VKLAELVPVPPAVVTLILPVTAPTGTVAVIWVAELTTKFVAATPPNFTEVAPVKPVPWIVTEVPTGPLVGVKDVIVGAVVTVKSDALVAVPPGVVTVILPVTAPLGTLAVTRVPAPFTENVVAATPPNFTEVAPVKPVPWIVTEVPTGPLVGVKDVIVGAVVTVKSDALVAVPPGVVTVIFPVMAPVGTVAVTFVPAPFTENVLAATPPNFTEVAPVKFVPLIVTEVPTGPLVGEKDVIVGVGAPVTVKSVVLVAVAPPLVTVILPVVAPVGTVAVSWVPVGFQENVVALVPLNFTELAPTNPEPLIVTTVPTGPLDGENDVIVGAHEELTVKSSVLVVDP